MTRKVIFVGLHNKPGKEPLCSSTKSGKLIDRIINQVFNREPIDATWQKTNLFNVEFFPTDSTVQAFLSYDWGNRINPKEDDIIVLLGAAVHKNWKFGRRYNVIKAAHPASNRSHEKMNTYVYELSHKIQEIITANSINV